jgi:hypothetical protein
MVCEERGDWYCLGGSCLSGFWVCVWVCLLLVLWTRGVRWWCVFTSDLGSFPDIFVGSLVAVALAAGRSEV